MAENTSEIKFKIELDEKNVPSKIEWVATDSKNTEVKECRSMMISLWDPHEKNTLRIDLWTSEMRVDEMHIHFLQTLMTLSESYQRATGHPFVMEDMKGFCEELARKTNEWEKERNEQGKGK